MNKQREALKLALELLETNFTNFVEWIEKIKIVRLKIREALAEPEKANQCGETCERAKLCAVCARGLDEPEQEPVADVDLYAVWSNGFHSRKPLTDTQIEQCMKEAYSTARGRQLEHAFARAIERAHGIGGGE